MNGWEDALTKIFEFIDGEELTRLAMDLVNISSPTEEEGKIAQFILEWLRGNGIEAMAQEVEEGRYNAVGRIQGIAPGRSLTLNAHLDTAFSGSEADVFILGELAPAIVLSRFLSRSYLWAGDRER